jgi:hypothetical protein
LLSSTAALCHLTCCHADVVQAERKGDTVVIKAGGVLGQSERSQLARLAVGIAGLAAIEQSLTTA